MHPNAELIRKFYTSFQNRDARGMAECYHPAIKFSDEVFTDLEGARAAGMWRMLCERGKDLKIEFRDIKADDSVGSAHWESVVRVFGDRTSGAQQDRRPLRVPRREDRPAPRQLQFLGMGISSTWTHRTSARLVGRRKESRPRPSGQEPRFISA